MKTIPLTKGAVAIVSDSDYESVIAHKWHLSKTSKGYPYARRTIHFKKTNGVQPQIKQYLHRFVLGNEDRNVKIIFKDGNTLNCQRDNMEVSKYLL